MTMRFLRMNWIQKSLLNNKGSAGFVYFVGLLNVLLRQEESR